DDRRRHAVSRSQLGRIPPGRNDAARDVPVGDDADRPSSVALLEDWNLAAVVFGHEPCDFGQLRVWSATHQVRRHDFVRAHDSLQRVGEWGWVDRNNHSSRTASDCANRATYGIWLSAEMSTNDRESGNDDESAGDRPESIARACPLQSPEHDEAIIFTEST